MNKRVWMALVFLVCAVIVFFGYQRQRQPLVSVVMLTYQRADMVPNAIQSILEQSYNHFEFIILNDGSTDNTADVIKRYNDSRIHYYENPKNMGINYSRNKALSFASGKYVMIMDDDDVSMPDRMKKQVEFLETHPDITVVSGQLKDSLWAQIPQDSNLLAGELIQQNIIGNANTMFRRSFVVKHKIMYPDISYGEDWFFWLNILFAGGKFSAIADDVIVRNDYSPKHYQANPKHTYDAINKLVGSFFSPDDPQKFYDANPCEKLNMIANAPKRIFTSDYLQKLISINCP